VNSRRKAADTPGVTLLGGAELSELRQLIRLVQRTGIGELEVSSGGRTVRISATPGTAVAMSGPMMSSDARAAGSPARAGEPPAAASAPSATAQAPSNTVTVTSPMVGTFYRAPAPDADPYVEQGDMVEVGQTVCIIEAMKLMNEIEAEVRGRIVQILVENSQPVEFGQALFLVEPLLGKSPGSQPGT
jgi:acetyl-CoA carboxylase biotin carboxyl carrier protein